MKKIFTIVLVTLSFQLTAQQKSEVLFTIDKEKFYTSEFKSVYEKNLSLIVDDKQKDIENYLELFVNFKLKVIEAKQLQLDTTRSYKREIATYKNQLIAPYLQDSTYLAKLIKDAYHRTKYKVNASHILVKLPKNYTPTDTLNAYHKIINARKEILSGVTFAKVATKFSDDPSVKANLGNLGYFTAFKMVYPFENAVYATRVDDVSEPFRTRFGYHIVKVHDKQLSEGEIEVAHILLTDRTTTGKVKIDSIYSALLNGANFEQLVFKYSNDKGTVSNGGKLPKFGVGRMFKDFEDKAFELKVENQYSKPFMTQYGWHIIKLLKKYPVASFEKMKSELTRKVRESGGAKMSDQMMLKKLKKKYNIQVNNIAYKIFEKNNIRAVKRDTLNQFIVTINSKNIRQSDFFDYIRNRRHKKINVLFNEFIDQEVLNYFKENLVYTEPEYANTLKEYEEGLLVFDLMQTKVWNRASTDSLGLQAYFKKNKKNYTFSQLSENKGKVMNDYQEYLEEQLIEYLKDNYSVSTRKKAVRKLINYYQKRK
jgi:peptidyl-prolyl cis-trans isomerase SurA